MRTEVLKIVSEYKSLRFDDFGKTANIIKQTRFKGEHHNFETCIAVLIGDDLFVNGIKRKPECIYDIIQNWNLCQDFYAEMFDRNYIRLDVRITDCGKPKIVFPGLNYLSVVIDNSVPDLPYLVSIPNRDVKPVANVDAVLRYIEDIREEIFEKVDELIALGCTQNKIVNGWILSVPGTTLKAQILRTGEIKVTQNSYEVFTAPSLAPFINMVKAYKSLEQ